MLPLQFPVSCPLLMAKNTLLDNTNMNLRDSCWVTELNCSVLVADYCV